MGVACSLWVGLMLLYRDLLNPVLPPGVLNRPQGFRVYLTVRLFLLPELVYVSMCCPWVLGVFAGAGRPGFMVGFLVLSRTRFENLFEPMKGKLL